jgi:hypothetical protein
MAEDQPELNKEPILTGAIDDLNLQIAVEQFEESFHDRSFSARNPELGKMIKCDGCGLRHRSSIIHERKFATDIHGIPCEPRVAEPKRYRRQANRYGWRERPNPLILLLMHTARNRQKAE